MKTVTKLSALLLLAACATSRAFAAFESFKVETTVIPRITPVMLMQGITQGKVLVALSINAEGKLTDSLVLGYTHASLIRPCLDAVKRWEFTAARNDGQPVAVQADLTIDLNTEGVVLSRPGTLDVEYHLERMFGPRFQFVRRNLEELDEAPKPITVVPPRYATEAEKDGVRGNVRVFFYIDETGSVRMPAVERSSHPYLSTIAVDALRSWRFAPPTSKGKPVMIAARQDFDFSN